MEKWEHIAREWRRRALGYRVAASQAVNPDARDAFQRRAEFYDGLLANVAPEEPAWGAGAAVRRPRLGVSSAPRPDGRGTRRAGW